MHHSNDDGAASHPDRPDRTAILSRRTAIALAASAAAAAVAAGCGGGAGTQSTQRFKSVYSAAVKPEDLFDNAYGDAGPNYIRTSEFARAVFRTDAEAVKITAFSDLFPYFPNFSQIGVRSTGASGVREERLNCIQAGPNVLSTTLPPGQKVVEIIAGPASTTPGPLTGTWLVSVELQGGTTAARVAPTTANRLVVYGDSTASGGNSESAVLQNWPCRIRYGGRYAGSVLVEAWGGRTLSDDAGSPAALAEFVEFLVALAPARLWMAIGANDYFLSRWHAIDFGGAYATLLDLLHARLPAVKIYCQTPLKRATETPNDLGSTLPEYRSQITGACAARPWARLVDGIGILDLTDLDPTDLVHPNTQGTAKYYRFVEDLLQST